MKAPEDWSCQSPKTHYWTPQHAKRALELIMADPDPWREYNPHRVIECDWCGFWVLTSKRKFGRKMTTRKPAQRGRRAWSGSRSVGKENRKR